MNSDILLRWIEQGCGLVLIALVALDIFLLVLYARSSIGILSYWLSRSMWQLTCRIAERFGHYKETVLSFSGPVILLVLFFSWAFLITIGAALVIHPNLGGAIQATNGSTPTDFFTAVYIGGSLVSTAGSGNIEPQTTLSRLFFWAVPLIGISLTTLGVTYLLQLYSALHSRNALGLKVHFFTGETNDAAELLSYLGPQGQLDLGYTDLSDLGSEVSQIKEAHHLYPILFYFRFRETYYSVSQIVLVTLDCVSLIKSALDEERYAPLQNSAAVTQLWRASMKLITTLKNTVMPNTADPTQTPAEEQTINRWRERYFAGLERLQHAGIQTSQDVQRGADTYVALRAQWDGYITLLAPTMAYDLREIDPVAHRVSQHG
jgi:hypothetical protein